MAWITPEDVADVYPAASSLTEEQIDHLQGLAEGCVGSLTEPVSRAVKSIMVDIAWRFWRGLQAAEISPEGYQRETTPEYSYEYPAAGPVLTGFGLTDKECRALKKAAGVTGLSVQRVSRGAVETPSAASRITAILDEDFDIV